jgi:hypothetical protein
MAVDDWAPVKAAAADPNDDWAPVAAPRRSVTAPEHIPNAFLQRFSTEADPVENLETKAGPGSQAGFLGAIYEGADAGFGPSPTGLSPEDTAKLRKLGIFQDPDKPRDITSGIRFLNEAGVSAAYNAIEATFRGLNAATYAAGAVGGQLLAEATGGNEAEQARARRDGAHMATIATLLAGGQPGGAPDARADGRDHQRADRPCRALGGLRHGRGGGRRREGAHAGAGEAAARLRGKGPASVRGRPRRPDRPHRGPGAAVERRRRKGSFEAAQSKILDKISVGESAPKEGWSWSKFYTKAVDDLHPLKAVDEDAYQLARLTRGQFGKAEHFIEHGTFDFNTYKTNGKPLKEILEPVSQGPRRLARLSGVEARDRDRGERPQVRHGRRGGDSAWRPRRGQIRQGGEELVDYQNKTAQYLKDSGVQRRSLRRHGRGRQELCPVLPRDGPEPAGAAGKGSARLPIKRLKGSERDIIDPLESIIKNTYAYISLPSATPSASS